MLGRGGGGGGGDSLSKKYKTGNDEAVVGGKKGGKFIFTQHCNSKTQKGEGAGISDAEYGGRVQPLGERDRGGGRGVAGVWGECRRVHIQKRTWQPRPTTHAFVYDGVPSASYI